MPIVGTRANASARGYGWSATVPESLDGMVLMMPTSIASTGTGNSSSIGANGSVTFSSCATLSLNGVFTADYDNYMIVMRHVHATSSVALSFRWRSSGTDASGANYTLQYLLANSTSMTATRTSSATEGRFGNASQTLRSGDTAMIYGPYLSQPTVTRNTSSCGQSNAPLIDYATTHSLSSSYDGITLIVTGTISGLVSVYGLEN